MKKVILGVLLVGVLLVGGGIYFVFSNLDAIVEQAIETAGTQAIGTQVSVESVKIELSTGSASIYGFAIANPEGYSDADMVSFDELSVRLDLENISSSRIGIVSIVALNPRVQLESIGRETNLDVVNENLGSSTSSSDSSSESSNVQLDIGSIRIDDIEGSLISDMLPNPIEVNLGDINLSNLSGTPSEIAQQVTKPLISQLAATAGRALIEASTEMLKEDIEQRGEEIKENIEQRGEELKDEAENKVREGLGNLLNRN